MCQLLDGGIKIYIKALVFTRSQGLLKHVKLLKMLAWHLTHGNRKYNGNTKKASFDSAQIKKKGMLDKSGKIFNWVEKKEMTTRPKNQHK